MTFMETTFAKFLIGLLKASLLKKSCNIWREQPIHTDQIKPIPQKANDTLYPRFSPLWRFFLNLSPSILLK